MNSYIYVITIVSSIKFCNNMPECCKYIFKFSHAPYVPKIRKISNYKLDIKYKLLIFIQIIYANLVEFV